LEINTQDIKDVMPKVGDTVTVHYTSGHHHYRADPENIASKIEVKVPEGQSNKRRQGTLDSVDVRTDE